MEIRRSNDWFQGKHPRRFSNPVLLELTGSQILRQAGRITNQRNHGPKTVLRRKVQKP
jgi:hypothetical protein